MKTAVVIPTLGRTFFSYNLVMALVGGTRKPDEIIVVDQTDPESRNPFALAGLRDLERQGHCQIIEHPVKSLTVARNVALRRSTADIVVFVDDDAFIPNDFVEAYEEIFRDESVDAATGMILVSEADLGTIDTSRVHVSDCDGQTMLRGGNFAVRRAAILAVGGMDENFVGAGNREDADLAWRLHRAGAKVLWASRPWLFHLAHHSGGGRAESPVRARNFAYNLCYFYLRRYDRITAPRWYSLVRWRVMNRENLARPWRLVPRMAALLDGYRLARRAAAAGPRLGFPVSSRATRGG